METEEKIALEKGTKECKCVKCDPEKRKTCMEAILANKKDISVKYLMDIPCEKDKSDNSQSDFNTDDDVDHLELEAKSYVQQFLGNQINNNNE